MESSEVEKQTRPSNRIKWLKLAIALASFLALSFGFAYILESLVRRFDIPLYEYAWVAYLAAFTISLVANLTILVLVPFAASFMIAAASQWDPIMVALVASLGGTIGELSSYYVGYLGKKIAAVENNTWVNKVEGWIKRYGMWALSFLALQPVIPFDVGGLIAGAARMPVWKYLLAILIGKFPKYIVITLAGIGLIHSVPFFSP